MKRTRTIVVIVVVIVAIAIAFVLWRDVMMSGGIASHIHTTSSVSSTASPSSSISASATAINPSIDMSGWNTFTSKVFGFSLAYPPTWKKSADALTLTRPHIAFGNPLTGTTTYTLFVSVYSNPDHLSSEEYVRAMLASSTAADKASGAASGTAPRLTPRFVSQFPRTVNGIPAYELSDIFEYFYQGDRIYIAHGSYVIAFDFPVARENPNIADPIANHATAEAIINSIHMLQ